MLHLAIVLHLDNNYLEEFIYKIEIVVQVKTTLLKLRKLVGHMILHQIAK